MHIERNKNCKEYYAEELDSMKLEKAQQKRCTSKTIRRIIENKIRKKENKVKQFTMPKMLKKLERNRGNMTLNIERKKNKRQQSIDKV